jgi:hypothetical protein
MPHVTASETPSPGMTELEELEREELTELAYTGRTRRPGF